MTTNNINDAGFDSRMSFVRTLMHDTLGFEVLEIETVDYERGCRNPYNNFVYLVRVHPTTEAHIRQQPRKPGTNPFPLGCDRFIVRLSSFTYHDDLVRVENEVAAMQLARTALPSSVANLVPKVFGWDDGSNGKQGWILEELMPGKGVVYDFDEMDDARRRVLLEQMVDIWEALQQLEVPQSVGGFGVLAFDESGQIISRPVPGQPSGSSLRESYSAYLTYRMRRRLDEADKNPVIKGWHENGMRDRLERFVKEGIPLRLEGLTDFEKAFVHGDLTMGNVLYDPATMRLTAFFDFDTARIGMRGEEFLSTDRTFARYYFSPAGIGEEEEGQEALRKALRDGFPEPLPPLTKRVNFILAKTWDDLLRARGVQRPATTSHLDIIGELFWLIDEVEHLLLRIHFLYSSREGVMRVRREKENELDVYLRQYNF